MHVADFGGKQRSRRTDARNFPNRNIVRAP